MTMQRAATASDAAKAVIATLQSHGYEAFLVGGCVRDLLLGRECKDYDVTTNATPDEIESCFLRTIALGRAFGVMVVLVPNEKNTADSQIEVATYRTDGGYSDARRPDTVVYSKSAKEDVVRRDFTINGLLLRSIELSYAHDAVDANVVDYVGGITDLRNHTIRCIGDPYARFAEDALRMLRAVRFAAQLGFEIEENTLAAIAERADIIKKISKERIAAELLKLVSAPFPVRGLVPLVTTGLAEYVLPFGFSGSFGGNFAMTLRRFAKFPTNDPLKGMAMLLAETDYGTTCNFLRELKLSNEQVEIIDNALKLRGWLDMMSLAELKKLARKPGVQINLDLFEQATVLDNSVMGEDWKEAILKVRSFTPEEINPKPLASGDDLIAMGLKPGPAFTKLLDALEIEQLNGTVTTHEEAVAFLTEQVDA